MKPGAVLALSGFKVAGLILLLQLLFIPVSSATSQPLPYVRAEFKTFPVQRYLDATIEAVHQATVSAQTSGRIIAINVDIDDYVKKGARVVQLRNRDQQAAYKAAKASLEEAQAENDRLNNLFEQKLIAQAVLDRSIARLKSARANFDKALEELENTVIRAPYSGIVVKRHVEVGEMARVGSPLMTGLSLESLRATVEVPQSLIHVVRKQKNISVLPGLGENKPIVSNKITISPYADPASHTFTMRLNLPEGDYGLYPGMFVKAVVQSGERPHLVVPATAITQRGEVTVLYILDEKNRVSMRHVRTGGELIGEMLAGDAPEEATSEPVEKAPAEKPPSQPSDKTQSPSPGKSSEQPTSKQPVYTHLIEILSGIDEKERVIVDPILATERIKQQGMMNEQ